MYQFAEKIPTSTFRGDIQTTKGIFLLHCQAKCDSRMIFNNINISFVCLLQTWILRLSARWSLRGSALKMIWRQSDTVQDYGHDTTITMVFCEDFWKLVVVIDDAKGVWIPTCYRELGKHLWMIAVDAIAVLWIEWSSHRVVLLES